MASISVRAVFGSARDCKELPFTLLAIRFIGGCIGSISWGLVRYPNCYLASVERNYSKRCYIPDGLDGNLLGAVSCLFRPSRFSDGSPIYALMSRMGFSALSELC